MIRKSCILSPGENKILTNPYVYARFNLSLPLTRTTNIWRAAWDIGWQETSLKCTCLLVSMDMTWDINFEQNRINWLHLRFLLIIIMQAGEVLSAYFKYVTSRQNSCLQIVLVIVQLSGHQLTSLTELVLPLSSVITIYVTCWYIQWTTLVWDKDIWMGQLPKPS